MLAVILERVATPAEAASGCEETFWWAAGITPLAIVPCLMLVGAERTVRARGRRPDPGVTEDAIAESIA